MVALTVIFRPSGLTSQLECDSAQTEKLFLIAQFQWTAFWIFQHSKGRCSRIVLTHSLVSINGALPGMSAIQERPRNVSALSEARIQSRVGVRDAVARLR